MKKLLLLLSAFLCLTASAAKEEKLSMKEMLAKIDGKWELDNNDNVTFTKVIEAADFKSDDLYSKILAYFTYTYNSGESVVQIEDKEKGLIIGKGIYQNVHTGVSLSATEVNTTHILRADIKDGRVRIIVTLQQYYITSTPLTGGSIARRQINVSDCFPVNEKGKSKTVMGKAFYKSYTQAMETFEGIDQAIKEGMTGSHEDETW